jgi:flagellar biosynthesis regulator FlaF
MFNFSMLRGNIINIAIFFLKKKKKIKYNFKPNLIKL